MTDDDRQPAAGDAGDRGGPADPAETAPDGAAGRGRADTTPAAAGPWGDDDLNAPATAGLAAAVVALVAATAWWPGTQPAWVTGTGSRWVGTFGSPLTGLFALVALVGFGARRWGVLSAAPGVALSGAASTGIVAASSVRLVAAGTTADAVSAGYGLPLALGAGLVGIGLAVADFAGLGPRRLAAQAKAVGAGFGITVAGFIVLFVVSALLRGLPEAAPGEVASVLTGLVLGPLTTAAFVGVAVAYVLGTERGWSFFDVRWPSLREVGLAVLGTIGLLVLQFASIAVIQTLDLPSSSQGSIQQAAETAREMGMPELVLVLVPMMLFVVGPAEELLFRNVIQKRLYEAFGRRSAVLVAGLVFASAHVLAYSNENHAAVFVSLATIFFVSLLLGFLYEYTENVVVVAAAHGLYNATLILFLYVALVYGPESGWAVPVI